MDPTPEQLEELLNAVNDEFDGPFEANVMPALAPGLIAAGWVEKLEDAPDRYPQFGPLCRVTDAGRAVIEAHAYRCWACGDWTTGTASAVRTYEACPSCIERETERRGRDREDDDDPGPFRPWLRLASGVQAAAAAGE
jgi:hypothetical protein